MVPLIYSNNANIKYPLNDFHEASVPNDLLLNLSLNIPEDYVPIVSVLQTSNLLAYLAIEDSSTHVLLASVVVERPTLARVYPLVMDVAGFGHVVFGPGLTTPYNGGHLAIPLDPDTVTYTAATAPALQVKINGIQYPVTNILRLAEQSGLVDITVEGSTVYFDRNDAVLTADQLNGFTDLPGSIDNPEEVITQIGGVSPDSDGNIDILFRTQDLHQDCTDIYTMSPRRTLEGKSPASELPLAQLAPRDYDPDYECAPDVPPDDSDPAIGPQTIKAATILDKADDNPVGVLYSTRGSGITPGSIIDGGYPDTPDGEYGSNIDGIYPESDDEYESTIENNGQ